MNIWVKKMIPLLGLLFLLILPACSSNSKNDGAKLMGRQDYAADSGGAQPEKSTVAMGEDRAKEERSEPANTEASTKMVIYYADLHLRVKKFELTMQSLEEKVEKYGGYIAESSVTREGIEHVSGRITVRIPQKHFQTFIHDAEGQAAEVLQRDIKGTDVTEEYVDLESRLKSKRAVEERLLAFMKTAEKTEDLLKISTDLAKVQEEIEVIEGRMKFLQNQTSFSTINITLYENKVIVPNLDKDDLNTWDKTKKQFMKSTNALLAGLSGLFVFLVGNLPILAIVLIGTFLLYLYFKKRMNRNRRE